MNNLSKFNIVHILVLLILIYIGVYFIPKLSKDVLISFISTTIYFIALSLFIIFWVIKFGIKDKSQLEKTFKPSSGFRDYFMMSIIFFGTFLISALFHFTEKFHLFDFLNNDLVIPVIFPSHDIAKGMPIFITILVVLSTIIFVIAEELFFRAYLFEKQFIYFNNLTWIANGLFYTVYHIFGKSNLIEFLPFTLLVSFIYQKSRNITITYIPHILINLLANYQFIIQLYA